MFKVTTEVVINEQAIMQKLESLFDDMTMTEIYHVFAEMCEPYVPYLTGDLSKNDRVVDSDGVHYTSEYASYQYYGTEFNHTLDPHPRATALWDKVMMNEQGDVLKERITEILSRRAKELYG